MNKAFVTIAASDSSGGAGIQQDLRAAEYCGYWSASVLTAVTAQDFQKVYSVSCLSADIVNSQLEAVSSMNIAAVKIGVIGASDHVRVIRQFLGKIPKVPVVLDPVLRSSSGTPFAAQDSMDAMFDLMESCDYITPNGLELAALAGLEGCPSLSECIAGARKLSRLHDIGVCLTGGHFREKTICDRLYTGRLEYIHHKPHKYFPTQHGTGCFFSSCFCCYIAQGYPAGKALSLASNAVTQHYTQRLNSIQHVLQGQRSCNC